MTIYAVGDIHGKREMLRKALGYLRETLSGNDYAVFLGDYIDRGEDSRGVVDDLLEFAVEQPKTVFLRGNHEQWLIDCYHGAKPHDWLHWGGRQTLESYGAPERGASHWRTLIPRSHLLFFETLPMQHRTERHWFVHAGLTPSHCDAEGWVPDLWARDEFIRNKADFGRLVVFGHTPQIVSFAPLVMRNKIGIDTAAAFGGRLTIAGFDDSWDYRAGVRFSLFQVQ